MSPKRHGLSGDAWGELNDARPEHREFDWVAVKHTEDVRRHPARGVRLLDGADKLPRSTLIAIR